VDPAHPAIHPTGDRPRKPLDRAEAKLYDVVVRRFLSVFAPAAKREKVYVTIAVGSHGFFVEGSRTIFPGWLAYYKKYWDLKDLDVPPVKERDRIAVVQVSIEEKFDQRPHRFNQSSLLEKMEREGIGTKATRADTISTLLARGYVSGESLAVTTLGESVIEVVDECAPSITTTELTRKIEGRLQEVEGEAEDGRDLIRDAVRSITEQLLALRADEEAIGHRLGEASKAARMATDPLGSCPVCKTGSLRIIRSKKTGKRFVGCTNYQTGGCKASAPLPQRGAIRPSRKPCQHCSWPVVYVTGRGRPWRLCVNPGCPSKVKGRDEVQTV
jgi:DNA topoisomerase-1